MKVQAIGDKRRGCATLVDAGLEDYFKRGTRPLMERHDERFLRLRTKRADGRSGSGAENRERQASRRYDMTPDTDHPRS